MSSHEHIYGTINNVSDLKKVFSEIQQDVAQAKDRAHLTELYRRAGYLITLTYAPSWEEKFHGEIVDLRKDAEQEFATTAKKINRKAAELNLAADYDEKWGHKK